MIGELKSYHCPRCGSDVYYRLWKWKGFVFCGGCVTELNSKPSLGKAIKSTGARIAKQSWLTRLWNWIKKIMRVNK